MVTLEDESPKHPITQRPWVIALLMAVGVQMWLVLGRGMYGNRVQWMSAGIAVALTLIPQVSRVILHVVNWVNRRSKRAHLLIGSTIWIVSCILLYRQAVIQHRYFFPKAHDEFAYLVQMQMLARGHLWYPKHPLGDFFDSFQMLISPVYAPMYFPGQALLYTPGVWFHLQPWVLPLVVSGASVMMMYVVFTRLFDRTSGLLAALLLLSISEFRRISIELFAHLPSLLFGLLMVWAYLRWKDSKHKAIWAIALGVSAGWSAITRPLDALMYAIPVGACILIDIFWLKESRAREGTKERRRAKKTEESISSSRPCVPSHLRALCMTLLFLVLGASPFLAMQTAFNLKVSGSLTRTPFDVYADRDFPMTSYGFHAFNESKRPASILPQKQAYHDDMTIKLVKEHTPAGAWNRLIHGMLPDTLRFNIPQEFLIILMPLGMLALQDRRRMMLFAIWPLFLILYFFYTFFLSRYVVPVAPAIILPIVGAIPLLRKIRAAAIMLIVALSITSLPLVNRFISDELFEPSELIDIARTLDAIPERAIVLIRWDPTANYQAEPVYNTDVAWPDDARVIRAHDLGGRNIGLYRYYAAQDPTRIVYRLDRKDNSLTRLGSVGELSSGAK